MRKPIEKAELSREVGMLILVAIVVLAAGIRIANLDSNPAGFFRDEADKGYTSLSLMETGMDQSGERYPLFVQSLSVTTSALYQYLNIPIIQSMGLSEFSVRLPAAIAGTASVVVTFLFAQLLWGTRIALWAALFVAISPWSVLLSRWANQSILLTLWVPLGVLCFLLGYRTAKASLWTVISALAFLLALYTYAPARLFVPLLIVALLAIHLPLKGTQVQWNRTWLINTGGFLFVLLVGCLPMANHIFLDTQASTSRLQNITIFDGQSMMNVFAEWCMNYMRHLDPGFLLFWGDQNPRHAVGGFGQLHWFIAPLLLAGIADACRRRSREDIVLLAWFVLFPVAAACTRESIPHGLRSVFAVPVVHLLAARGLLAWFIWQAEITKRFGAKAVQGIRMLWLGVAIAGVLLYFATLFWVYPVRSAVHWEHGYREAVQWWIDNRGDAQETVVSGLAEYPYIFFLFYDEYDPQRWMDEQAIEGVRFLPTMQTSDSSYRIGGAPTLYLVRPDELARYQHERMIFLPTHDERRRQAIWKWVRGGEQ